ncbi:MAG: SAM-dependent methyltransferase [Spirochaeta sp. LUC14_002_19_P3]|nr:MAG: SAM-dependent methyltransferase [Spirochaeta sp. LUC14_002_19_P3]
MNYKLLIDLHKGSQRQGPGGNEQTKQALQLAGLMGSAQPLTIADIGCGTGASTLMLAENLNATITAVDLFQDFLDILDANAQKWGIADKITTLAVSMEELPFEAGSLDVFWAEGAIYNMGFAKGLEYFKCFLKPGGILAVSEITWLTGERPAEIQRYWDAEYPEIATASEKIKILEEKGYVLKGYFPLPESSWMDNYYTPLENTFDGFIAKHNSNDARAIVEAEKTEIALYKKYKAYYSYGFYTALKI